MSIEVTKWQPRGPIMFAPLLDTTSPHRPGVFGAQTCADQASIAFTFDYTTHDSKCSALVVEDYRRVKKASAEISIQLSDFTLDALITGLSATTSEAEAVPATVVDEELPEMPDEGGIVLLGEASPNFNITSLTIEDSASPPVSLTVDVDYTLDAPFGTVEFGDVSGFTQPLKASYSHQNPLILGALAAGMLTRWVRFNGVNAALDSAPIVPVDIFKMQVAPTSGFDLVPDDLGKLDLKGSLVADLSRNTADPRGRFMSVGRALE